MQVFAFGFIFTYQAGLPDMPAFARHPRHRRTADAPRIEIYMWTHAMARRVEAAPARDWIFGFVNWNYLFRSEIKLSRTIYAYERKNGDSAETKLNG